MARSAGSRKHHQGHSVKQHARKENCSAKNYCSKVHVVFVASLFDMSRAGHSAKTSEKSFFDDLELCLGMIFESAGTRLCKEGYKRIPFSDTSPPV